MSKRYIDADDLFEALNRTHQKAMAGFDWVRVAEVMQTISRVPTADVAEVVRCKDCIHLSNDRIAPERHRICRKYGVGKPDDGFCDEGERKEVDDETR